MAGFGTRERCNGRSLGPLVLDGAGPQYAPVSSILRHRKARASALIITVRTPGRGDGVVFPVPLCEQNNKTAISGVLGDSPYPADSAARETGLWRTQGTSHDGDEPT